MSVLINPDASDQYDIHDLEEVSFRNGNEDAHRDSCNDKSASDSLEEDGVLNLAQSRLLYPDLTIEDFSEDVPFLILGDPRLIFVAISAAEAVEGGFAHFEGCCVIVFGEELPGTEMAVVHAMKNLVGVSR